MNIGYMDMNKRVFSLQKTIIKYNHIYGGVGRNDDTLKAIFKRDAQVITLDRVEEFYNWLPDFFKQNNVYANLKKNGVLDQLWLFYISKLFNYTDTAWVKGPFPDDFYLIHDMHEPSLVDGIKNWWAALA